MVLASLSLQMDIDSYVIYYISKNLTPVGINYIVMENEFLVIVCTINKFFHYIIGYPFFLCTDNSAIRYLANKLATNGQIIHWLLLLQEFDITIKDQLGKENLVVDFLSRIPIVADSSPVEDQFPDKHLFCVTIKTP